MPFPHYIMMMKCFPGKQLKKRTLNSTSDILKAAGLEDLHVRVLRAGSSGDCSHTGWECESLEMGQKSISKVKNSVVSIFKECD